MKKPIFLLFLPLLSLFSLSAQVTQEQADSIVIQRLNNNLNVSLVYAKEDVQQEFEITTTTGEILEFDYPCWVYYVKFTDETNGKYMIVKENTGNVLEVNTKNDAGPDDWEDWRSVLWYAEYSLSETFCVWTNPNHPNYYELIVINSNEELKQYISCAEGNYPEIDFSRHTLLLTFGWDTYPVGSISENLQQLSPNNYQLNIKLTIYDDPIYLYSRVESYQSAIVTTKLSAESNVALNITTTFSSCYLINLSPESDDILIVINSNEELENYIECATHNDFPNIDFENHTLLLAAGTYSHYISKYIDKQLTKTGDKDYILNIYISWSMLPSESPWIIKSLIAKLPEDVVVSLKVVYGY